MRGVDDGVRLASTRLDGAFPGSVNDSVGSTCVSVSGLDSKVEEVAGAGTALDRIGWVGVVLDEAWSRCTEDLIAGASVNRVSR